MLNTDTIKQEIEDDKLTRDRKEEDEINPYEKGVLNNVYREDIKTVQMVHWSIMSDVVKYVPHDKGPKTIYDLNLKALGYRYHKKLYDKLKGEERQTSDIDLGNSPVRLKEKYLDMYEGVYAEMLQLT